jgi:hypothetical protein
MKNELGCEAIECCNGMLQGRSGMALRRSARFGSIREQIAKENDVKSMRNMEFLRKLGEGKFTL